MSKLINLVLVDVTPTVNFLEQAKVQTGKCSIEIWFPDFLKPWFFSGFFFPIAQIGKFTAMIILPFRLQP